MLKKLQQTWPAVNIFAILSRRKFWINQNAKGLIQKIRSQMDAKNLMLNKVKLSDKYLILI